MPSRPGRSGRAPAGDDADRQRQAAAELSDRAAESVDRRYDATKETHLEGGEGGQADERDERDGRSRRGGDRGDQESDETESA